jgi:hypothetical protein
MSELRFVSSMCGNATWTPTFLGNVEGFPEVLVNATSDFAERYPANALAQHLNRLQDLRVIQVE